MMKRVLRMLVVFLTGFASLAGPFVASADVAQAAGPQTYTVWVGAEDASKGIDVEAYFPDALRIHVGDTVQWKQNTHEIHTVTFLAGSAAPDLIVPAPQPNSLNSPLMLNPAAAFPVAPAGGYYDGSALASSGTMSLDPGQPQSFSLTFTKAGTYAYICLVHGQEMSGKIIVENPSVNVPSPSKVASQIKHLVAEKMIRVPAAFKAALSMIQPPTRNPDGTKTYHVMVGFMAGQIDLMRFFPDKLVVHPGDTVEWTLSMQNDAPHTVTFLNGNPDISFVAPVPQPNGPPLLLINPAVLFPSQAGTPLTRQGVYSSGLLNPGTPNTSFSLKIGNITGREPYECLLHDSSGMTGMLIIAPRNGG